MEWCQPTIPQETQGQSAPIQLPPTLGYISKHKRLFHISVTSSKIYFMRQNTSATTTIAILRELFAKYGLPVHCQSAPIKLPPTSGRISQHKRLFHIFATSSKVCSRWARIEDDISAEKKKVRELFGVCIWVNIDVKVEIAKKKELTECNSQLLW